MSTTSLRGRGRELGVLTRCVMSVAERHGCVVLVEGPAGVGKSRLLYEACTRARHANVMVTTGGADEFSAAVPLVPLLTALGESDPPILLGEDDLQSIDRPAGQGFWLIERLHAVLEERARIRPILIALDDLQWADPVTLHVVQALVPALAMDPIMWLLSRNLVPTTRALENLAAALKSCGATVISLRPLSSIAVDELTIEILRASPEPSLMRMVGGAGGNPSLIVGLLSALIEEGALSEELGRARLVAPHPPDRLYQQLAWGQLRLLSDWTRQVLEVASFFGPSFDIAGVTEVLRCPVAHLLPAIREALRADILVETGARLRFRHDLVREAACSAVPISARAALHREVASALLSSGAADGTVSRKTADPRQPFPWPTPRVAPHPLPSVEAAPRLLRVGHGMLAGCHRPEITMLTVKVRDRLPSMSIRGRTSRPAEQPNPGLSNLTEAELRVARLAATGLTNRAIADRLHLSRHTVDSHLKHTFTKLGIASRVQLTRFVLTQDPAPGD